MVELRSTDYHVKVRAQGVVRAREEITLGAQVAARVVRVAPEFEDGSFFEAGTVLVELEDADFRTTVALADARLASAEAAFRLAELNQQRDAEMLRNNLLPAAQADVSTASLAQARAEMSSARAQGEQARRDLERTRVRAPFAGCVRRRVIGLGQWVNPGTTLGSIFSIDAVEIRLPVAGPGLAMVRLPDDPMPPPARKPDTGDQPSEETVPAPAPFLEVPILDSLLPSSPPQWQGRLIRGEQALDGDTLERFLIVRVMDPFRRKGPGIPLRPGQPVTALIPGRVLTNVLVIPRLAVHELNGIHLVDPKTLTLTSRRIEPLWSDEEHVVVRDPSIPEGSLVTTTHLVYAPEGAGVEIIPDIPAVPAGTPNPAERGTNAAASPATP